MTILPNPTTGPRILGTGLIALDIVLDHERNLLAYGLGGSAGNVLSILASLGWSSTPIGKIGCDIAADIILDEFKSLGAELCLFDRACNLQTPVIYQHQLNDASKTHKFSFACPMCGVKRLWEDPAISLPSNSMLDAIRPTVLYMDRATPIGIQIAEYYRNQKVLIVFEPSALGDDAVLFEKAIAVADIVKYADDRLEDLEAFDRADVSVEICTMGRDGLKFRAPSLGTEWVTLDAFRAPEVVDTSGAGDWCTSGMLYHLFNKNPEFSINAVTYNQLNDALRFGQALSALNCMALGARGLAKALPRNIINKLALKISKAKFNEDNVKFDAANNLREGWSRLISARLAPNPAVRLSSSENRVCCHTSL
jgi:fructokinase